jgi:hypothetical protein
MKFSLKSSKDGCISLPYNMSTLYGSSGSDCDQPILLGTEPPVDDAWDEEYCLLGYDTV